MYATSLSMHGALHDSGGAAGSPSGAALLGGGGGGGGVGGSISAPPPPPAGLYGSWNDVSSHARTPPIAAGGLGSASSTPTPVAMPAVTPMATPTLASTPEPGAAPLDGDATAEALLKEGRGHFAVGRHDDAVRMFDAAAAKARDDRDGECARVTGRALRYADVALVVVHVRGRSISPLLSTSLSVLSPPNALRPRPRGCRRA
jgi:hypothetical protein